MTPKQLKESTERELLIIYKNKARCFHSRSISESIYKELAHRLGDEKLYKLGLETRHIQYGGCQELFNKECDNLLKSL